jgi:hypothetical protein
MTSTIILPSSVLNSLVNGVIAAANPRIHLNQVNAEKLRRNVRGSIYLPGDNWISFGNGIRMNLDDFDPVTRPRRSHYINDFNSTNWTAQTTQNGLRLRVEFETFGSEIKGYCRTCRIGNRDRRAADVNILAPKGSPYPFVEVEADFNFSGGKADLVLRNVDVGMNVDGNGFLELVEGLIGKEVRKAVRKGIIQGWNAMEGDIETAFAKAISSETGIFGGLVDIKSIQLSGGKATIEFDAGNTPDAIYSHFSHTLNPWARQLKLLGNSSIRG